MKSIIEQMKSDISGMQKREPKAPNPIAEKPANDLLDAIDEHLLKRSTPFFKKKGGFSPSDTNDCSRRMVYLLRGVMVSPDNDARTQRIFDNGHSLHERLTKYLDEMGILLVAEEEVSLASPPIPRAFIDAQVMWAGQRTILEFKSISEEGFTYRKTFNKPKDDHVQQVRIYMRIKNLKQAYIIYENKNNQELLAFKVEQDDAAIDKLFVKWNKTYKIYTDGKLPKRPVKSPESKKCTYCEVKSLCWSDPDLGI